MLRVWEIAKTPKVKAYYDMLLIRVRADLRTQGIEEVIPVFRSPYNEKFEGYITPFDILTVTSAKSNILVKDVIRTSPYIPEILDINEAYHMLKEFKVQGAPVVKSIGEPEFRGVISYRSIVDALLKYGITPKAEHVIDIMKMEEELNDYVTFAEERVNRVWSKIVYRRIPGLVVVKSSDERIPIGTISVEDFINTGRWYFHREAEHMAPSPAKVKTIMMRGTYVATPDMPITHIAKIMVEQSVHVLPVVDKDGKLVGVVTMEDLAGAFIEGVVPGRVVPPPVIITPMPKPVAVTEQVKVKTESEVLEQVLVARVQPTIAIGIKAKDIMRETMPAVLINDTIEHARREMLRRKTNYLLVVDEKSEIVGYISKGNMLRAIGTKGPLWRRRVYDRLFIDYIITRNTPAVPKDARIEDIALQMITNEVSLVKVVDVDGSLLGFITKDDVVFALLKAKSRGLVENVMTPRGISVVHPHHSLHHVITRMKMFYLDALVVYDGRLRGIISENRIPFVAFEDAKTGIKSRRLIWIRKLVRGAERKGRYIKITPLLAMDVMVSIRVRVDVKDDINRAIELMQRYNVDGIPVVNAEGEVLGIVCKNDIIRDLARSAKAIEKVEREARRIEKVKA